MHVTSAVQHLRRHCHSDVFSCRKSAPSAKCQAAVLAKVRSDLKAATCAFERHQAKKASNASNVINLFAKCVRAIELPGVREGLQKETPNLRSGWVCIGRTVKSANGSTPEKKRLCIKVAGCGLLQSLISFSYSVAESQ